jgi:hypothetical protein
LEPLGESRIREGNMKSLDFSFSGNNNRLSGPVKMIYDHLKIDLLETDTQNKKTDRKFISSLFANIKIKDENPKGDNAPRVASVSIPRELNYSIFKACWQGLYAGIAETTGIIKK